MKNIYTLFIASALLLVSNITYSQTISGYNPDNDATTDDITQNLILTFSEDIAFNPDFTFLEIALVNSDTGSTIETWTCLFGSASDGATISNNQLILDPTDDLTEGTNYHITIDDGAIFGFSGIDNSESNYWRFSTSSPLTFYPEQNSTDFPLDADLTLTFQGDIFFNPNFTFLSITLYNSDLASQVESWVCINGNGQPGVSIVNNQLIINPSADLTQGTNYYITIDDGAIEGYGGIDNSESNNWRFKTIAYQPVPNAYNPEQDAINVPIDQSFQLTFDRDIQWADVAVEYKIRLRSGGSTIEEYIVGPGEVDSQLQIDGDQLTSDRLTITPYNNLDINTSYFITIPSGLIESTYGATFEGINNSESNNWRFTTVGVPIWTDGYPFTENLTLANIDFVGQTDKDGIYNYVVSASTAIPNASQVKNGFDGDGAAALITNSGTPGTMTADTDFGETLDISSFTSETTYYIYLVATSSAGSLDSEVIQIPFTTLERNPPIASFNPVDGTNNVSILTNVVITFDEPVRMLDGTIIDNSNVASLITFLLNPANPVAFTATIDATKSIITISPDEPLNDNSGYDVTIAAVEDYYGNQQLSSSTSSFSTDSYVTWNGGSSSDWTANQNWDGNFNEGASVHIQASATNMPIIDGVTTIQNILIDAGASLSITTNGDLTVNGDLTLNSSNDELIGNASLINNGSISVHNSNVHIHQRISSSSNAYYISSPVSGVTMNDIGCDYGISYYDNTLDSYAWMTGNDFLSTGTGYLLYSYSNLEFSGAVNNANQYLVPLLRTANAGLGWNLVGNPYPASINWDLIDEALKVDIVDAIWIYLNDQGIFGTYSPIGGGINLNNGEIPSNHAFWVKVLEGDYTSGSITLPKSSLVSNSKTILKSTKSSSSVRIKLAGFNDSFKDETAITFSDLCDNLQDKYDAEKKFSSNKNYFQIYTIEPFNSLAINGKAALTTEDISIQIGFRAPKTGSFSIKAVELSNIPTNKKVLIEDTYNETIINLSEQDSYSFSVNKSGNNNDRFIIHIENELSTSIDSNEQEDIRIYGNNDQITVEGNTIAGKKYEITTLDGRTIKNGIIQEESKSLIHISYKGIVIVGIFDNQSSFAQKVLLK